MAPNLSEPQFFSFEEMAQQLLLCLLLRTIMGFKEEKVEI